ncbi:methylated-DNA--[protein]-cysteine S-methyltransferase [Shimwellia pseudoproteus]|nr:methylated-DNA--[protein]-cysteine S-methyltransferase [Shimwellia pseudoproteus]
MGWMDRGKMVIQFSVVVFSVRAVATAIGANRIATVISHHRIMAKDGYMTGYGGGIAHKAWLIEYERY